MSGEKYYSDNENRIKVSVILPIYNVGEYLKTCLNSIIHQSLKEIEIICINDGSTDDSMEILNEYVQRDSRFKVISQENQGQGVARNKGVELAKGKYIQFVDPDDWIELNMLEKLYNFAEEHNAQIVKFNYTEYNDYSGEYKKHKFIQLIKEKYNYDLIETPYYSWKILKNDCLTSLNLRVWTHFYKTSFIKSNKIICAPNKLGEDHLFVDGAIVLADKIYYLNEYLYLYRIRNGSAVHVKNDANFCIFENINLLKDFLINHNLFNELEDEWKKYAKTVVTWNYNLIPDESIKRFENNCIKYFSDKNDFNEFLKTVKTKRSFLEQIFSVKNDYKDAIKYKVITVLGRPIYIKPPKKSIITVKK